MNKEKTTKGIIAAATQPVSLDARPGTFPEIERQVLQHRAIEAIIWGMPAVNRDLMYQPMLRETACRDNQMLYWSRLLDWKTQTLTPNMATAGQDADRRARAGARSHDGSHAQTPGH